MNDSIAAPPAIAGFCRGRWRRLPLSAYEHLVTIPMHATRFEGEITHLSQKGLGVVQHPHDGHTYFVAGTWPGDLGRFEISDRVLHNKKYGYARLIRLIQPSRHRQPPACAFLGFTDHSCSGCPWMIADYASQLEHKRHSFLYAMTRVGFDTHQLTIGPVQPSPRIFGYRNRFQVKTDGKRLGFVTEGSRHIAPVEDCIVLNDSCRQLLQAARHRLPCRDWTPAAGEDWSFLDLDDSMTAEQIQPNRKRPFRQGNTAQNIQMQAWLKQQLARNTGIRKTIELFCGSGNFTEVIAQAGCPHTIAYESSLGTILSLRQKQLPGVEARVIDLYQPHVWKILRKSVMDADTLVLDPPRSGLKNSRGFFESFTGLTTIYYISCNPESFARDAWTFHKKGWWPSDIQLIDLFPHTPHVEVMAVFNKPDGLPAG